MILACVCALCKCCWPQIEAGGPPSPQAGLRQVDQTDIALIRRKEECRQVGGAERPGRRALPGLAPSLGLKHLGAAHLRERRQIAFKF